MWVIERQAILHLGQHDVVGFLDEREQEALMGVEPRGRPWRLAFVSPVIAACASQRITGAMPIL
jgi:hypothetical protein